MAMMMRFRTRMRPTGAAAEPEVPAVHQELDAVVLGRDRVGLGERQDLDRGRPGPRRRPPAARPRGRCRRRGRRFPASATRRRAKPPRPPAPRSRRTCTMPEPSRSSRNRRPFEPRALYSQPLTVTVSPTWSGRAATRVNGSVMAQRGPGGHRSYGRAGEGMGSGDGEMADPLPRPPRSRAAEAGAWSPGHLGGARAPPVPPYRITSSYCQSGTETSPDHVRVDELVPVDQL